MGRARKFRDRAREQALTRIAEQVAEGRLTIRQATPDEIVRYGIHRTAATRELERTDANDA